MIAEKFLRKIGRVICALFFVKTFKTNSKKIELTGIQAESISFISHLLKWSRFLVVPFTCCFRVTVILTFSRFIFSIFGHVLFSGFVRMDV